MIVRRLVRPVRRLAANRRGAVAVEFGLVAIPFFLLLFAIVEVALEFFVLQILDTATTSAARLIRTGEAYKSSMTAKDFKDRICAGMMNLVDCEAYLTVDVQQYSSFSSYVPTSPLDKDGKIIASSYSVGSPQTKQIMVVRAFYAWPVMFNMLPRVAVRSPDGREILSSVVAFRTESFPSK
jgi:Flp pilus assembly protein TadG